MQCDFVSDKRRPAHAVCSSVLDRPVDCLFFHLSARRSTCAAGLKRDSCLRSNSTVRRDSDREARAWSKEIFEVGDVMARYLLRACPRCNSYVGIVIREPGRNTSLQAVNGRCTQCSYRMAWIVIRGREDESRFSSRKPPLLSTLKPQQHRV